MGEGEPKSAAEKAPKNKQDMRARLYGALLLLPLLLFLWVGGLYFSVILIALCALMSCLYGFIWDVASFVGRVSVALIQLVLLAG